MRKEYINIIHKDVRILFQQHLHWEQGFASKTIESSLLLFYYFPFYDKVHALKEFLPF